MDLDGTLLNSNNEISKQTKKVIYEVMNKGHKMAIITGRDYYSSIHVARELFKGSTSGILSSSNGAHVFDLCSNKVIYEHKINSDVLKDLMDFSKSIGIDYMLYKDNKIMVEKIDTYDVDLIHQKNKIEVLLVKDLKDWVGDGLNKIILSANPEKIKGNYEKIKEKYNKIINPVRSMPQFIDCIPYGINKGVSMGEIGRYYGIGMEDTISFGDGDNDIEMIVKAGCGVSMKNGSLNLKKMADFICLTNDNDGIADFLENYVINS